MIKYIGVIVVVALGVFLIIPKDGSLDNLDLQTSTTYEDNSKKEDKVEIKEIVKEPTTTKVDSLQSKVEEKKSLDKEESSLATTSNKTALSGEDFNEESAQKIVGYQEVYEHIQDNNLKAIYEEPKVLNDKTLMNIYIPQKEEKEESSFVPPQVPTFVTTTIKNEKVSFVVPSGTSEATVTTTDRDTGEIEAEVVDLTSNASDEATTDSTSSESKVELIAPPQIGVNPN